MPALNRTVTKIIGVAVFVGIGLLGVFMLIKPQLQTIASLRKEIDTHNAYAQKKSATETQLAEAKAETLRVEAKMKDIYRRAMPDISLKVPVWAMFSLWYETGPGPRWFRQWGMGPGAMGTGPLLTRYFDDIGLPVQGITVSPWGLNPPDQSTRVLPPLSVTLRFTFTSFERFLKLFSSFERAPRFMVVQGARLSGQSPNLVADVPAIVYAWTKDYAAAPAEAAGGEAGAGMPGMMVMPGMPGMSGMMGMPGMPGGPAGGTGATSGASTSRGAGAQEEEIPSLRRGSGSRRSGE